MQPLTRYRTISIMGLAVAGILFAVYLMPASLADDRPNVVIATLLIWVSLTAAAWAGFKAWPSSGRLKPFEGPSPGAAAMGKQSRNPLEEPAQEGHWEDVPEPPADHIVRGYGAMNPTEGDVPSRRE